MEEKKHFEKSTLDLANPILYTLDFYFYLISIYNTVPTQILHHPIWHQYPKLSNLKTKIKCKGRSDIFSE